jgi:hypothetical protein
MQGLQDSSDLTIRTHFRTPLDATVVLSVLRLTNDKYSSFCIHVNCTGFRPVTSNCCDRKIFMLFPFQSHGRLYNL